MTTALELIRRSLRLINEPGRGRQLAAEDANNALDALKEIIDAESVSTFFQPGRRQHFFACTPGQNEYTYGPGGDFDTNNFGDDSPLDIEDCFIRGGAAITDREQITNGDFTLGDANWTLTGSSSVTWQIANGRLRMFSSTTSNNNAYTQALTLTPGAVYTFKYRMTFDRPEVPVYALGQGPIYFFETGGSTVYASYAGSESRLYETTFTPTAAANTIGIDNNFESVIGGSVTDIYFDDLSLIEQGKERFALGRGSDYIVRKSDQKAYNRRYTKGPDGRPTFFYFNRQYPLAQVVFDNSPSAGDVAVFDVMANQSPISSISDTLRLYPIAERYLRHRLAFTMATEYSKRPSPALVSDMNAAYEQLSASNSRVPMMRVDAGLQSRSTWSINRGDP